MCSGSWDCRINLWLTNEFDAEGDLVSIKKRRKDTEMRTLNQRYKIFCTSKVGICHGIELFLVSKNVIHTSV